jgi:hypothetical protein
LLLFRIQEELLNKAVAQGSYADTYAAERLDPGTNNKGLWIRSFLITPGVTNKWYVDRSTILNNIYSIVGKPIILDRNPETGKPDHPKWNYLKSAQANMIEADKKTIGVVEKVFYNKENDSYYADSKITDPTAREYIKKFHGRKIPQFNSNF